MMNKLCFCMLLWSLLLTGCSSVQFSHPNYEVTAVAGSAPILVPATTPISSSATLPPGSVYKYGRFTVTVPEAGPQVIEGGIFVPSAIPPRPLVVAHTIFVNYVTKELTYYRLTTQGVRPVVGYAVVTPAPSTLPSAVVEGKVTQIDTKPSWCPTPNIRKQYPDLPPGCLPFGHPENAMGAAKFIINWKLPKAQKAEWSTIRLHGASGYPAGSFWGEETFGCTRLQDDALKDLIKALGPTAVREGIALVLLKGDSFAQYAL